MLKLPVLSKIEEKNTIPPISNIDLIKEHGSRILDVQTLVFDYITSVIEEYFYDYQKIEDVLSSAKEFLQPSEAKGKEEVVDNSPNFPEIANILNYYPGEVTKTVITNCLTNYISIYKQKSIDLESLVKAKNEEKTTVLNSIIEKEYVFEDPIYGSAASHIKNQLKKEHAWKEGKKEEWKQALIYFQSDSIKREELLGKRRAFEEG
ncbi:MAG: hypothetical protein ACK4OM_07355, partial [Alphaproteobacteria bacterium]